MEKFMKGDVVVIPFPFSDLSSSKKRPALVLATLKGNDIVLCQITSEARFDEYSIELKENDFKKGKLNINSMIRPNKLFITLKDANEEASLLALQTSTPAYIFECISVVEVKKVEYMSKAYNVRGELIPNE